jgi:hypothetical protein
MLNIPKLSTVVGSFVIVFVYLWMLIVGLAGQSSYRIAQHQPVHPAPNQLPAAEPAAAEPRGI